MRLLLLLALLGSCSGNHKKSQSPIKTKEVVYQTETTELKGYLAKPNKKGKRPGILIFHEWWGHNEYVRKRAEQLAAMGYIAFAVDMYGDGKNTAHPKEANEFMTQTIKNLPEAKARILAGIEQLKKTKNVDPDKLAAIGYCFGGGVVLNAVQMGINDFKAVVSFHGSLGSIKKLPQNTPTKLLVLNGAADPMVKPEHITNLKKVATKAKADLKFINYPGAKHAFTNPGATEKGKEFNIPLAYNKSADEASWQEMTALFKSVF